MKVSYHGNQKTDPQYFRALREMAPKEESHFAGPFPGGRAGEVLDKLDLVVVPSIWFENAPVVISEAFRAGVPVIASRMGGMQEMVTDGKDGRLFEPGDADDLARVLTDLAEDRLSLRRLSEGVTAPRSVADDARGLLELYSSVRCRECDHE
jgi:glycosyltransferase involved in cell wall biosynthesis